MCKNYFLLSVLLISTEFNVLYCQGRQMSDPEVGKMAGQTVIKPVVMKTGLLFYLSGEKGFDADFASGGQFSPNYLKDISVIEDGAIGKGFRAENSQLMTYWAPGNIYAQRGTLSFFWRSRYPVGPSPFPVFRVAYADHSSWDMVWLRIDYNGSGFDAFVTDIGLSRTRISWSMDKFPEPDEWIHLALSWDETTGIRFYVNGEPVAEKTESGNVYDTGLDQFGPHSRIISPYQVQSAYSFTRGGDLDELRIYDRMLTDKNIADLSSGKEIKILSPLKRDLNERHWRDAWWTRNGWNLPNQPPPLLPSSVTSVRKVEIHDAFDIKRWYWKANDGIRETTWPGVYNMSRLPGRYDYFVLPDWDCYSGSGQSVKFTLPDEPWNHIEIWGKAWGQLTLETFRNQDYTFGVRSRNQVKSWHQTPVTQKGGIIRFDNALIEEPIGSFDAYYVDKGSAPEGILNETFSLTSVSKDGGNKAVDEVISFIHGRYPADERTVMLGLPGESSNNIKGNTSEEYSYPFINIIIPYKEHPEAGLDGVEILFPEMKVRPTHNGVFPLNIRIKDPLWQIRDLADFNFSVYPGDSPKLWIDTRDRILPEGRALYITVAGAGKDLTADLLNGTLVRLVYKKKEKARIEHEIDRFTQIRDLYAMIVEERPNTPRLNLYNRFMADCNDLLSVNPDHWLAQTYYYAVTGNKKPVYKIADCPSETPEWAFLQIEYLRHLERMISYYIDNRQIANGEFGGGLSDDGDLTNMWPGISFLGIEPEKMLSSLLLHMEAYYDQDRTPFNTGLKQRSLPLFTNGLATIFTDELHALEEGIQVVAQAMLLDYGNPLHIERGMETTSRLLNYVTQVNPKGHRHFRSRYYGATQIALEDPWQWSLNNSYHVLQPSYLIARYNGNPEVRQMITDLADGILEHQHDGKLFTEINFSTDEARDDTWSAGKPWSLFSAAYGLTGNKKYLEPKPSVTGGLREFNKEMIAKRYKEEITNLGVREYINTEGSIWIDRLSPFNPIIQEDRLGGIALTRTNVLYPGNYVSWKFNSPASWESVAVFLPLSSQTRIDIIAYNLDPNPVSSEMTLWDIKPGKWRVRQGVDTNDDQLIDENAIESFAELARGELLNLVFAPGKYTIVSLELIDEAENGYWELPDPGIGTQDVKIAGNKVIVRVHNLGAVDSPVTILELKDAEGKVAATAVVPSLEAPLDLKPRCTDITLSVYEGTDLSSGTVQVDPERKIKQITRRNDIVKW